MKLLQEPRGAVAGLIELARTLSQRKLLASRIALNIYFWLFLFAIKVDDITDQHVYTNSFYLSLMLIYMVLLASLCYFVNLYLAPKFLFKGKTLRFALYFFLWSIFSTLFYVVVLKLSEAKFEGLQVEHLSVLTSPITADFSVEAMLLDFWFFYIGITFLLVFFHLAGVYHFKSMRIHQMEEAISRHRDAELAFLRNQVNPHFLFNTLNNLYGLSLKKSEQTSESILKLSNVLRYILYESNTELVPFNTEKEVMQSYIDIELLRIENSPKLGFSITSDKPYLIPPLVWLPVLENVFKHTRMVDELEVDFRFSIRNYKLTLYCRNNMSQIKEPKQNYKAGGIGLENLRKRLELIYPGKHELKTGTEGDYFLTELRIELK